jgi:hypothetical protein
MEVSHPDDTSATVFSSFPVVVVRVVFVSTLISFAFLCLSFSRFRRLRAQAAITQQARMYAEQQRMAEEVKLKLQRCARVFHDSSRAWRLEDSKQNILLHGPTPLSTC